ncbi:MAG: ABC transporter transmembrane domain-containing protein, partial [Armatimonadota bacterium]
MHMRGFPRGRPHGGPAESDRLPPGSWALYRRLLGYVRAHRWLVVAGLTALCIASFIGPLPYRVLGLIIDTAIGRLNTARLPLLTGEPVPDIFRLAGAYLTIVIVGSALSAVGEYTLSRVGQRIVYDFRTQLHAHLQRLALRYYETQRTGEIVSRVMGDVDAVESSVLGPVTGLITDFAGLAGVLTVSFSMDWRLTLIALTVAPAIGVLTYFVGKKIRATFRVVREKAADLTSTLHDGVAGIRVIRGFAREPVQQEKFERDAEESFRWNMRIALIFAALRPTIRSIVSVTTACIIAYGGYMIWRDRGQANPAITVGMLTTFL